MSSRAQLVRSAVVLRTKIGIVLLLTAALTTACAVAIEDSDAPDAARDGAPPPPIDSSMTTDVVVVGDGTAGDSAVPGDVSVSPGPDASMFPAFLRDGRTYDQERDYIAWEGGVSHVSVQHRDNTSLPPSEGGGSCSSTCTENITRIESGGRVWGRFSYVQSFSVQVASGGEAGIGTAVIEACGMEVGRILLAGGSTLGFSNQPQPAFTPPTAGDCQWSVRAVGGWVPFRAVTVSYRGGSPPTVDVRVNGMNGPLTFNSPADYVVSWTSTSAASCTASGSWTGPRDVAGAVNYSGVAPGTYTYTVTCANGGGSAMDSASVTVNRPPG